MNGKIKNVRGLQQQIVRLKTECNAIESELEARTKHLQQNYIGMAANTAIYSFIKSPKNLGVVKDIFSGLLKADTVKDFLKRKGMKFLQAIAVRLGFKIMDDFAGEKTKRKARAADEATDDGAEAV